MTTDIAHRAEMTHALLADGRTVEIRQARPEDIHQVLWLYEEMSPENLRLRFFGASRLSGRMAAERFCGPPRPGFLPLIAFCEDQIVGVAEYETDPAGPATAEVALAVADDFHHRGVGTLLLEHLVHAARANGVATFTADALADNHAMLQVFADLGLSTARRFENSEVHCTVGLEPDERYLAACDERGRTADAASLRPLLRPRSIAVVGAGTKPGSVGRAVLRNIRRAGFGGALHAVNPHTHTVEHTPCYPSVTAIPEPPELAVLAVPARAVPQVAEECGKSGVRALVVLTSGLDDAEAEALLVTVRRYGMRLVGPNCLGIANTEEPVRLDATFAAHRPLPGTAGVAVQSGGVGIALLGGLSRLGVGVSSFVSLGDKYDVSGNDLLQWWEEDGRTDMALLHLESFGNPRAFSRTARRVTRKMPLLTVDAGRSDAGRRAAASHTAAAATPTMTRQALFTQAGIIATRTVGELLDTAALLHAQPLPTGSRVAVVSNAGGAGVLAADACVEAGLSVPELPADLVEELLEWLPPGASATNPVDATAAVGDQSLSAVLDRLSAHEAVDAVLLALVPTALAAATGDDPLRALTHAAPERRRPRTVAAVLLDQAESVRLLHTRGGTAVPAYADPQAAARALAHAAERARFLARPTGTFPELHGTDADGARALVDAFLAEHPDGGWLDPRRSAELLDHYRIPQLPWAWAEDEQGAVDAAARLAPGPEDRVVLKAYWPGLVHKTDEGAVLLDLAGEEKVRQAYRSLAGRFGEVMTGVLVQPMAERGTELVAGVVQDQVFGPLVLFGLGGTATELLADHAARLAPLTDRDVHDLITAPRSAPLLFGYRGGGPVDLEGLEQLLLRVSRMACDLPQLAEADLNPVVARPDGVTALDVRIRLLPRQARDPYLRRLR
ncbi:MULTISPECIES: bifunctional acetate--CoA ligase family protein/GNAT family N-acetyltransferase [Streptomyces]|uniref:GNAT family N-acetyltransferase n=3 Tax=Streptomyces TaxID=1883 RepID=A0A3M8ERD3_9ACTN|nr:MULTISPECIES: bifunctional GNAT family N-acetyltransferase/acetate--CoA ligase family protein [Streptomyces]KNE79309.1 CoA-binding protein [Streptomyces fradiae]PQM19708.1 GNAT family N-acetyltransferase [Streptomyces xinghaiensis]RKM90696.1 GNAT family N-acetyltransferase [Streptomyces xinghaiensis]RNC68567.1 GNAT family N-acetyltransferase [Streptomyces xinghaiensis]